MFRLPLPRAKPRRTPVPGRSRRLAVEPLEDRRLLAVVTVTNTSDEADGDLTDIPSLIANPGTDGSISLREAILAANHSVNSGGPDEIHFAIPAQGVQKIMPNGFGIGSGLPAITDPVVLDGFTQGSATANSNPISEAINATPLVELDGTFTFMPDPGLVIGKNVIQDGSGSTIRGLIIRNFSSHGILIDQTNNNVLVGNFIGTDPGGTTSAGNAGSGVYVLSGSNNRIGGTDAADRNLISSNNEYGIVFDSESDGNQVLGNFIGTTAGGDAALGNLLSGVLVRDGSSDNVIGGNTPDARNLISANGEAGIEILNPLSNGNQIQGNFIGTAVDGSGDLGNSSDGIVIYDEASNNLIGGTADGAGNTIAYNSDGVSVLNLGTLGNAIRRNSIFSNDDLAIDLSDDGVTANDLAPTPDADEGPNRLQNFPVLVGPATRLGDSIALGYRVDSATGNSAYPLTVEFFVADSSSPAEGQAYFATDTYLDTEAGTVKSVVLPAPAAFTGARIVATATDAAGNTSEFSLPIVISAPVNLGSEPTVIREDSVTGGTIDFFQYRAHSTGKLVVRIDFIHAFGDLDLEVRDKFGNLIAVSMSSSPTNDFEEIIVPVVAQQQYFIGVFGNGLNAEIPTAYSLELENFPAPVPTAVHLDPASDTGRLNNDNRTGDNTPTFFIQDDVLNFVDTNGTGLFEDPDDVMIASPDAIDALTPAEAGSPGAAVEVTLINTSIPTLAPIVGLAQPLSAAFPTTYVFTPSLPLPDGVYFVTAATRIWDGQGDVTGQPAPATGRSDMSPPLWFTIDTMKPNVVFGEEAVANDGLDPASDTGVPSQPTTIVDRITSDSTPTLWGTAEANATVRAYVRDAMGARVLVGETVATPFGGNDPNAAGRWTLTSQIDLNDPLLGFSGLDGVRQFEVEAEDVAGNVSAGAVFKSVSGLPIPDDGAAHEFTFNVSGLAGTISDLNVSLNILHAYDSDLAATLISPQGTAVPLFTNVGLGGVNFINTTFDDEAATVIGAGFPPYSGSFQPEGLLSAFDGEEPNGTWTLRITDSVAADEGTLLDWTLCFQQTLATFIDTQGPRVAGVSDGLSGTSLVDKPQLTSPSPAVSQIKISFVDGPPRNAEFLPYPAVNQIQAQTPGNYRLVGDHVGVVPIVSVLFADNTVAGMPGMTDVTLVLGSALPDDHYTLTVLDNLRDNAGNRLDGEYFGSPAPFPTGDGVPGGDFVTQFTIDAAPELGVWAAGTVLIDANGNLHDDGGFAGGDLAFTLGFSSDYIIAGNFANPAADGAAMADGWDKLAAYGRIGNQFRWMVDFTNDGVPDAAFNDANLNGIPLAGNFDGNATNGVEVGLLVGQTWYFDTDHDFTVGDNAAVFAQYQGFPFAGDFDGDGDVDVGTYIASQSGGNLFSIDINTAGVGSPIQIDGMADYTFRVGLAGLGAPAGFYGFPGVRERPVAADMNGDGVDDIGLWAPDGTALVPGDLGEWFFLVSNNDPATPAIENTVLDRISGGFVSFTPTPFGQDIYAQYGNSFALPVVGNFDPPPKAIAAPAAAVPSVASSAAASTGSPEVAATAPTPPAGETSNVSVNESIAHVAIAAMTSQPTAPATPTETAAAATASPLPTSAVLQQTSTSGTSSKVARNKSNRNVASAATIGQTTVPPVTAGTTTAASKSTDSTAKAVTASAGATPAAAAATASVTPVVTAVVQVVSQTPPANVVAPIALVVAPPPIADAAAKNAARVPDVITATSTIPVPTTAAASSAKMSKKAAATAVATKVATTVVPKIVSAPAQTIVATSKAAAKTSTAVVQPQVAQAAAVAAASSPVSAASKMSKATVTNPAAPATLARAAIVDAILTPPTAVTSSKAASKAALMAKAASDAANAYRAAVDDVFYSF